MGRQWSWHLLLPIGVFLLAVLSEYSGLDLWLADQVFDGGAQTWPFKNSYLARHIFHDMGRSMVLLLAVVNLLLLLASYFLQRLRPWRRHLWFVLIAAALGPALVSLLKAYTHIYTPWDLQIFGGSRPYVRLFDPAPPGLPAGRAFPGGHSSGGFAFLSLYFLLAVYNHPWKWRALLAIAALGSSFAAAQELRGAHLLSHDLVSLGICWSVSLLLALVFYREEIRKAAELSRMRQQSDVVVSRCKSSGMTATPRSA